MQPSSTRKDDKSTHGMPDSAVGAGIFSLGRVFFSVVGKGAGSGQQLSRKGRNNTETVRGQGIPGTQFWYRQKH
eukprot:3624645-Rhodomonas_salina.5